MCDKNVYQKLEEYFLKTPKEQIKEDWASTKTWDSVGVTCDEFIEAMQNVNNIDNSFGAFIYDNFCDDDDDE